MRKPHLCCVTEAEMEEGAATYWVGHNKICMSANEWRKEGTTGRQGRKWAWSFMQLTCFFCSCVVESSLPPRENDEELWKEVAWERRCGEKRRDVDCCLVLSAECIISGRSKVHKQRVPCTKSTKSLGSGPRDCSKEQLCIHDPYCIHFDLYSP